MSIQEQRLTPDQEPHKRLLILDPAKLMQDNPAALIVNQKSYDDISAYPNPIQFDFPQVVKVRSYSAEQGKVVKLFVLDGLTRTKFVYDHRGVFLPDFPDFSFDTIVCNDVTESVLKNRSIVPAEEYEEGQQSITMTQYLRAVVPRTAEHAEIAPDRIAAHLINGWDNMVGEKISQRFSALVALSLLAQPGFPSATAEMMRKYLRQNIPELIANETLEERVIIENALVETAAIIQQAKLFKNQVAEAAFGLVATGSPVIGGEKQTIKQIYGLLYTPSVEAKLLKSFPQVGEKETQRTELGKLIYKAISSSEPSKSKQVLDVIADSLNDPNLTLDQVLDITTSTNPEDQFRETMIKVNTNRLQRLYSADSGKTELTDIERGLIKQLGSRTFLRNDEIPPMIRAITSATSTLNETLTYLKNLELQRDELIEKGVRPATIDEAITNLSNLCGTVLTVNSTQTLLKTIQEITVARGNIEQRILYQINSTFATSQVEEIYGEKVQGGLSDQIKLSIVNYVLSERGPLSETQIRQKIKELNGLDEDLQSLVIKGDMTIGYALNLQKRRKVETQKPPPPRIEETIVIPPPLPASQPLPPIPVDTKEREERRIKVNDERLQQEIAIFKERLQKIDLSSTEMTAGTKYKFDDLLRLEGQKRFNHPDIVRIVYDHFTELEKRKTELETKVQKDIEESQKDTRTNR